MTPPPSHEEQFGSIEVGLRSDIFFARQRMSGQSRYVAHDPVAFASHVLSAFEYRVACGLLPHRTLSQNFDELVERGVLDPSSRESFYEFVLVLNSKHLLRLPITSADTLLERLERKKAARRKSWYSVVSYFKLPLLKPDAFLNRTVRYVGWLFSKPGLLLWSILMLVACWTCLGRFGELFGQSTGMLELSNLPIMWITLVVLKVIHEFGHAYACKRLGGAVPEMGAAFIVMTPCAYVDAGACWTFSNRWQRITVSMAGMYVESMVAAVFALIWAGTQPGLVHDMALNVVVLASLVTLLFNLNPLMKFDGYFVLSDLLGVINLRQRSDDLLKYLARRIALGTPRPPNDYTRRELWMYWSYAPCSFLYKISLAIGITSMMIMTWPSAGLVLGILFGWILIGAPLKRVMQYLLRSEDAMAVKVRARRVAAGMFAALPLSAAFLPMSVSVIAPGVLELEERESIRAPVSGFVTHDTRLHGQRIETGALLCKLDNPELELQKLAIQGEVQVEQARLAAEEVRDLTLASMHRARLGYLRARSAEIARQIASMSVCASVSGAVVSGDPMSWLGTHVSQGQELFQVHSGRRLVRVVLTDEDVLRTRLEVGSTAEIRWISDPSHATRGIVREIRRSASRKNVPVEVTMLGGGDVYANRVEGQEGLRADRPYLHVLIEPESRPPHRARAGLTARVRMLARVETLGGWTQRWILTLYNAWRMS